MTDWYNEVNFSKPDDAGLLSEDCSWCVTISIFSVAFLRFDSSISNVSI